MHSFFLALPSPCRLRTPYQPAHPLTIPACTAPFEDYDSRFLCALFHSILHRSANSDHKLRSSFNLQHSPVNRRLGHFLVCEQLRVSASNVALVGEEGSQGLLWWNGIHRTPARWCGGINTACRQRDKQYRYKPSERLPTDWRA